MGFGDQVNRWVQKTQTKLERLDDAVLDAAYEELERRLQERLPEETPEYSGRLKDSYLFRRTSQGLEISSDLSYARAAIFQTTQDRNAEEMILRVAQEIVNDGEWLAAVQARAFTRL